MLLDGFDIVQPEGSTTVLLFHIFDSLLNGKSKLYSWRYLNESVYACESEEDPEPYQPDRNISLGSNWNL